MKIPFKLVELEKDNYHITVNIWIDDRETTWIVDTGASKTVIDSMLENFYYLSENQPENIENAGVGSSNFHMQIGTIKTMRIHLLEIIDLDVAIVDLSHVNIAYQKYNDTTISGLLGSDFLMKYGAIINYKTNTIELS